MYPRALQTAAFISRETGIKFTVEMDLRKWEPDKTFRFKSAEDANALYQDFCNNKGIYPNGKKINWEKIDEIIDRVDYPPMSNNNYFVIALFIVKANHGRLALVVVLPTPPFWLATAITLVI